MKMEIKVFVLSFVMSLMFIGLFTYFVKGFQKCFFVLQVGIYSKEENKNDKVNDLRNLGLDPHFYCKDDKYYVYTYVSDNYDEVKVYQEQNNIKGIIKEYYYSNVELESFKKMLKDGDL